MFAQVDSSIDRSQGGLGIGLTLVRKLDRDARRSRVRRRAKAPARGANWSSGSPSCRKTDGSGIRRAAVRRGEGSSSGENLPHPARR